MIVRIAPAIAAVYALWLAQAWQPARAEGIAFGGNPSEWTREDTARQVAWSILTLADRLQTLDIARDPRCYEINPLLGRHPSDGRINSYFAASLIAKALVSSWLPAPWRERWQGLGVSSSAYLIGHNDSVGRKTYRTPIGFDIQIAFRFD